MPIKKRSISAPFGYFGSKNNLASHICQFLPPHNAWVEAFCGSAAITLAKNPAPLEIINDINNQIVNFFDQLRNNSKELCRVVALTPYARYEFERARSGQRDQSLSKLEQARRFLVLSMMAINGAFGKDRGGFSYSQSYSREGREARVNRWYNVPERIEQVVDRLRSVRVENMDARDLIKMFKDRPATLFYMDPPYFSNRRKGYDVDAPLESFHSELLEIANNAKCMILISGYDNKLYNEHLSPKSGWSKTTIKAYTRGVTGKDFERTEVLWMNELIQEALKKNVLPIQLTKKEKEENKINPSRN